MMIFPQHTQSPVSPVYRQIVQINTAASPKPVIPLYFKTILDTRWQTLEPLVGEIDHLPTNVLNHIFEYLWQLEFVSLVDMHISHTNQTGPKFWNTENGSLRQDTPAYSKLCKKIGLELWSLKFMKGAVMTFNLSILADPNDVESHMHAADACQEVGDIEAAKCHYLTATILDPLHIPAHIKLANMLQEKLRDYEWAQTHYSCALKLEPRDSVAHVNLANLLADHLHDFNGAKTHYQESLRLKPNFAAHNGLANLLYKHFSDFPGAEEHYQKALNLSPNRPEVHTNLAILLAFHFQDYQRCVQHLLRALSINPNFKIAKQVLRHLVQDGAIRPAWSVQPNGAISGTPNTYYFLR